MTTLAPDCVEPDLDLAVDLAADPATAPDRDPEPGPGPAIESNLDPEHEHRILRARVLQSVPLRHPAFGKLLQLLSVEASREVPTAAVTLGARSRLLINPDFVARRCRTDAHLSMLVMHELYHVLLGHTRMYRRTSLAANWAFDCIINAQLCRLHPDIEHTSFFRAGAASDGPWSLIGPVDGWPHAPTYAKGLLGDLHRRLYDDSGVTTAELFALLDRAVCELDEEGRSRLLGGHAPEEDEGVDPLEADPDLMAEARRIVARWPMVERRGGVDDGGAPFSARIDLRRHPAVRRAVHTLLSQAARGSNSGPSVRNEVDVPALTPLPQARDRRAQLQRLLGATPLLWEGLAHTPGREPAGQVTVYLDVSGSMQAWLPVLLRTLADHAGLVRWPVLGFSTEVHPIGRADMQAGRFKTTGGTHIACVAQHMVNERVSRAVVITDGDVQHLPTALQHRLKRLRPLVHVGLIDGCHASLCERLGWRLTRLPALDAKA